MQKNEFEVMVKELLPDVTAQAMEKWTQYAQELEQDGTEKQSDLYDAAYVELKAKLLDTDSDDLADRTRDLMDVLEDGPDFLDRFDAELFDALVEKIIVDSNERLRFRLKNGIELTEQIERTRR